MLFSLLGDEYNNFQKKCKVDLLCVEISPQSSFYIRLPKYGWVIHVSYGDSLQPFRKDIKSSPFFHFRGRYRCAFSKMRTSFYWFAIWFFIVSFIEVSVNFFCLSCLFYNLLYVEHFPCPVKEDAMPKIYCGV